MNGAQQNLTCVCVCLCVCEKPFGISVGVTIDPLTLQSDERPDLLMIMYVPGQFLDDYPSDEPQQRFCFLTREIIYVAGSGKSNEAKSGGRIIIHIYVYVSRNCVGVTFSSSISATGRLHMRKRKCLQEKLMSC